jgi:hypothetical protein
MVRCPSNRVSQCSYHEPTCLACMKTCACDGHSDWSEAAVGKKAKLNQPTNARAEQLGVRIAHQNLKFEPAIGQSLGESETRTSPRVCDCNLEPRSYELLSWTTSVTDDALPMRKLRMSMKIRWKCSVPACKYVATHRRFCFFPGPSLYTSSFPRSSSHLRCSPRRPRPAMVEAEKAGREKLPKTTDLDRSGERLTTRKNPAANAGPCVWTESSPLLFWY